MQLIGLLPVDSEHLEASPEQSRSELHGTEPSELQTWHGQSYSGAPAHGTVAGSASALLGTVQFALGASAGALVGALGNGTAVPLAAVIAGCAVLAFATYQSLPR